MVVLRHPTTPEIPEDSNIYPDIFQQLPKFHHQVYQWFPVMVLVCSKRERYLTWVIFFYVCLI